VPRILLPLAEGFEEIEAVSLIDVMRRGGLEVIVASLNEPTVQGANHIVLTADTLLENVMDDQFDMIVLPGGFGGTEVLAEDERIHTLLQRMDAQNKPISAICAAPYALKCAGVLKEHYTCYPGVEESIAQGTYINDKKVVVDGNIMTSRGPGTAICFGIEIVRYFMGDESAEGLRGGLIATFC